MISTKGNTVEGVIRVRKGEIIIEESVLIAVNDPDHGMTAVEVKATRGRKKNQNEMKSVKSLVNVSRHRIRKLTRKSKLEMKSHPSMTLIPKSKLGTSVLVHVLTKNVDDHVPSHLQGHIRNVKSANIPTPGVQSVGTGNLSSINPKSGATARENIKIELKN